ncbi:MAG: methyltransferase domain-containing protein [Anaerolineae bacterium]|nr:methyltransferase domain-containing protein [Anaerolineae bacterium]
MESSTPFDALAPAYDRDFTASPIARHLRARVHARLDRHFQPGDHVLEFGCGTGEDALHLAGRSVRVTATDVSAAMLAVARAKTADQPLITIQPLDLNALPSDFPSFDGAFANFGVLNCLTDWHPQAAWLASRLPPGGVAAFGVMSPLCLWEIGWHGLHGDFRTAFRRLRGQTTFQSLSIRYPTIHRLTRNFAPHFRRILVEPLGLMLPPSDVYGVIERRPRLLRALTALDKSVSNLSPLALYADH